MLLKLISLHKYWIHCNFSRDNFRKSVQESITRGSEMSAIIGLEESSFSKYHLLNLDSFGYYRSYWYSSIFIVIEGYTDLKIKNEEIDKLLENKVFVDQLRLFRNATFHYQKDLYNAKFTGIDDSNEFITWINKLHKLFGDCILNEMHKLVSPEVSEAIKANFDRILKGETKPD